MGPYMQSFTCICLRPLKKNNKKPRLQINGETKPLQCPSHGWSVASASTAWLRSGWRLCRMTLRSLGLRFSFCCWKEDWTQKTRLRRLITMDNTSLIEQSAKGWENNLVFGHTQPLSTWWVSHFFIQWIGLKEICRKPPYFIGKNHGFWLRMFPQIQTISRCFRPFKETHPGWRFRLQGLHAGRNWWLWWAWGGPSLGPGTDDPWNDLHQLWVIIWLTLNNYGMIKHIHHMWLNMNCD